jgi:hypothetical protein
MSGKGSLITVSSVPELENVIMEEYLVRDGFPRIPIDMRAHEFHEENFKTKFIPETSSHDRTCLV